MSKILGAALALALTGGFAYAQTVPDLFVAPRASQEPAAKMAEKRISSLKRIAKRGKDGKDQNAKVVAIDVALLAAPENLTGFRFTHGVRTYDVAGALESRTKDGFTWFGKVADHKLSTVILVVRDGKVTGEVRGPLGLLSIVPLGDGNHGVAEIDESLLPPDHLSSDEAPAPVKGPMAGSKDKSSPPRGAGPAKSVTDDESDTAAPKVVSLNVLVGYTAKAEELLGDIEGEIALAEQQANYSYKNSTVRIRLKVSRTYQVRYDETKRYQTGVVPRTIRKGTEWAAINKFAMPELLKARTKTEDIAVLVISNLTQNGKGECGKSNGIGLGFPHPPKDRVPGHAAAFAAVKASCLTKQATLAHEIGHIIGARHNWEKDRHTQPCEYGHGLYSIPGRWRTIMAYDCAAGRDVCRRILYWSNPELRDEDGGPMGDRQYANDAGCLNEGIKRFCSEKSGAPCRSQSP